MIPIAEARLRTTIPATPQEWYAWLQQEEAQSVKAYLEKPQWLIADYYREREITRDYKGREILELLQNANDQAAEVGQGGHVCIELFPEGLVIANTGQYFSTSGVASLQTSSFSPKRMKRRQIIGNKGLGFRSVLNWSHTPIILSGGLHMAYSLYHARNLMEVLRSHSIELDKLIRSEQREDKLIFPLLSFPLYTSDGELAPHLVDEKPSLILGRCQAKIAAGYDTAIGMPFDQPESFEFARAQIEELRPEILLFTQNLAEIRFHIHDDPEFVWMLDQTDGISRVICNNEPLGAWHIYKTSAILPLDKREDNQDDESCYEITIAVPTEETASSSPLFSFFPTDVILPLPVICHATLDLEQSRKHIQEGRKGNKFVLDRLANFLAEIAEKIALETLDDPWSGCDLLMPRAGFPVELAKFEFPQQLIKAAQSHAIVPTLGGKHVMPDDACLVKGADADWLPAGLFPDVVPVRDYRDSNYLKNLGVEDLELSVLKQQILDHPELTLEQRVALIAGLLQYSLSEVYSSALLLNRSGRPLADNMRVFISPGSGFAPDLPDWLDIRFLNEKMRSRLISTLDVRDNRGLQQMLSDFGLLEYSLASLISALVAAANREIKSSPQQASQYEHDLLGTIFRLYSSDKEGDRKPDYPEKSPLQVINQLGESVPATELYLGHGFGTQGEIVQELYQPWAPEKLIAPPETLGLTSNLEMLKRFLLWIGVAEWPRDVLETNLPRRFTDFLLRKIPYPARFQEFIFQTREQVQVPYAWDANSIDGLEKILENSNPGAITAWLSRDPRAPGWQLWSDRNVRLGSAPGQKRYLREYREPLPSFVRWMFETSSWLVLYDGHRASPRDCVLGERAIETLFPHPAMPEGAELSRYGVHQVDIIEGWRRAGVLTSLASLERDDIYAKLLELPSRSPDGKLARPLYQWLLDASEMALGENGLNYEEFLASGKMWGRFGDAEDYYPISELYHADTEGIPQILFERLKIVDLRKRVGADKVVKLFGVQSIDNAGIQRDVLRHAIAAGSNEENEKLRAAKPYLFKLRVSQTAQVTNLQTLKDLELVVCSSLRAKIMYKDEAFDYDVRAWDWLLSGKTLYLCADPADPLNISPDMLADAIGDALASIFRLSEGGEFARMFLCKDKDRLQLLRKMRGDSAIENIEAVIDDFNSFQGKRPEPPSYPPAPAPRNENIHVTTTVDTTVSTDSGSGTEKTIQPETKDGIAGGQDQEHPTELQITPEDNPGMKTISTPPFRITRVLRQHIETVTYRRITDGEFCELKAMEFEQYAMPPRFPLRVSQITGSQGAKCDILSFATEHARQVFQAGETSDLNTVVRFIEVKGRSDASASIELKGNEFSAAVEYGERYYIYRLSESSDGEYLLTTLQNPLRHKEALKPAVYVDLEGTDATQRFSLSGGLKKNHAD